MVRKALTDAGYTARVTSTPGSHTAQTTTVDNCDKIKDVAAYLGGCLVGLANTRLCEDFVSIRWF